MDIKDLAGLSEPLKKFIEVISSGLGTISKSYFIKKNADAKAYEIKKITQAIKESQNEIDKIELKEQKLNIVSFDNQSFNRDMSLEERAHQRIEFKERKKQMNIEEITYKAAEQLSTESDVSKEPVDEDWITRFFDYAEDISNEEMQELWARILAGEVQKPNTYSLRTLDVLRNISKDEADIFLKFASLSIVTGNATFILNFQNEKLLQDKYQLKFKEHLLLAELGILVESELQYKTTKTDDNVIDFTFKIGNKFILQRKLANKPENNISVIVFTKIGQELLQLVDLEPDIEYIQLLAARLNRQYGAIKYADIYATLPNGKFSLSDFVDVPLSNNERCK